MSTAAPAATTAAQTILETHADEAAGHTSGDGATGAEGRKPVKLAGKYDSVEALEKAYKELESRVGGSVRIPGDGASAEDWAKFYTRVGRPEAAEGYELPVSQDPGQDEVTAGWFKQTVHALGLSKKQAEAFWKASHEMATERRKAYTDAVQKDQQEKIAALTAKWGDDYSTKVADANRVAHKFGGPEFVKMLRDTRLGDNPVMLTMLAAVRDAISEDTLRGGTVGSVKTREVGEGWYPKSPELK